MPGLGEHNNHSMSERGSSSSPQRSVEGLPSMRAALPSRVLSKEDIEIAEQLVDHSQGIRDGNARLLQNEDRNGSSSMTYEVHGGVGAGSSFERTRHLTPRSEAESSDRNEPNDSYRSQIIPSSETTPGGQVCRYVNSKMIRYQN